MHLKVWDERFTVLKELDCFPSEEINKNFFALFLPLVCPEDRELREKERREEHLKTWLL